MADIGTYEPNDREAEVMAKYGHLIEQRRCDATKQAGNGTVHRCHLPSDHFGDCECEHGLFDLPHALRREFVRD